MDAHNQHVSYRGFEITVAASVRFGGILVSARVMGGPDNIARQFGLPSAETDIDRACDVAIADLCALVDRLLASRAELSGDA